MTTFAMFPWRGNHITRGTALLQLLWYIYSSNNFMTELNCTNPVKQHLNNCLAWPVVYNFILSLGFSCSVIMLSPWSLHRVATQILIHVYAAHQRPAAGWKWPLQTDKRNYKCTLFFISCAYKAVSATLVCTLKALPAKAAKVPWEDIAYTGRKGFFCLHI